MEDSPRQLYVWLQSALMKVISWGAHGRAAMMIWMVSCNGHLIITASHVCLSLLTLCGLGESLLGLQSPRSLVLQPLVVLEEGHQGLGLLPHVEALVLVLLHKLEILQGLNCKYVLLALLGDLKI